MKEHSIICTSFFGLEKPSHIPPNHTLTGPLMQLDKAALAENLVVKDPELAQWLDQSAENEWPVLYITIGSECEW